MTSELPSPLAYCTRHRSGFFETTDLYCWRNEHRVGECTKVFLVELPPMDEGTPLTFWCNHAMHENAGEGYGYPIEAYQCINEHPETVTFVGVDRSEWVHVKDWDEMVERAASTMHAEMVRRGPTNLTWESAYPDEQADFRRVATMMLEAALGVDDDG